jgi:hypothetical protein
MNAKLILFLSCFAAVTLAASVVNAAPRGGGGMGRGGGGGHFSSMSARGGPTFARGPSGQRWSGNNWNGQRWSRNNWRGGNWNGNWRHHRHNNNDIIFIGGLGFPWWGGGWGYPYGYGYGYPYGYGYGYGYPYGYGYDYNYYGDSAYGNGYGNRYRGQSTVVEVQRQLAQAGYYRGSIDGIMGPQTRRAIRAYERSREYGMTNRY